MQNHKLNNQKDTVFSLQGKVVLISGATSGIGEATAIALAEKGATLVLIGRSLERADATAINLRTKSGNPYIDYLVADLSDMNAVRDLANNFSAKYDRLDVLVNNAGALYFKRETSIDGYERTFALNHLSYFLLTNLLLDKLSATAALTGEARIVNVASEAHRGSSINFNDLMFERRFYEYGGFRSYSQSKLANVLFSFELARRLGDTSITVNSLHPGFVASNFGKNNEGFARLIMNIASIFGKSVQIGSQTSVYLASWPELRGVTGKYFIQCQPVKADPTAYDRDIARRLWEISEDLVY